MWEDYESYYVREDALAKLKHEIEDEAGRCSIEVRLLGGLLKFTPLGVYTKVLLELEQPNFKNYPVIYKHRNGQLTSEHKGKAVSTKWVVGFLKHHSSEAQDLIKQHETNVAIKNAQETERDTVKSTHVVSSLSENKPEQTYGYSANKGICPVCNGDGGAAGQCYKCGGSGWA
ncbi:hypothetical protein HX099_08375 [Thiopseudomonas alkaliphila]|uniref:Uncharacterized protein n=1 Tax=Thiopseudomonas alkaliphila TaxID=1697053 RepID=A0AAW7DVF7_9GAMM|nr:hypothetical protein [Thiopseudomonas alkaliphila]MDM1696671.1 hypothetical protein [Thiopseudomonas alkaliphila]